MKNNLKIVIAFVLGVLISGISVYAVTQINASSVTYTKDGTDTTVDAALNDLYTLSNKQPSYYGIATSGRNNTASSDKTSFTVSSQVGKGTYLVVVVNSSVNGSALELNTNATQKGSLSGCDNLSLLLAYQYGNYGDSVSSTAVYANQYNNFYICKVNSTKTLTFTHNETNDDKNTAMIIFKY